MKGKITRQEAHGCNGTIQVGYCELQYLLMYENACGYNCGAYGWNFDSYYIDGVVINTGYRSMVGKTPDYNLVKEYNEKARKIYNSNNLTHNQKRAYIERLLQNFIKKAIA